MQDVLARLSIAMKRHYNYVTLIEQNLSLWW